VLSQVGDSIDVVQLNEIWGASKGRMMARPPPADLQPRLQQLIAAIKRQTKARDVSPLLQARSTVWLPDLIEIAWHS